MLVGIYTNRKKDESLSFTSSFKQKLSNAGIAYKDVSVYEDIADMDVLAVLGGDGTILQIAPECARKNIPILGINIGKLGFLTEFEWAEVDAAVEFISKKDKQTEKRSLLKAFAAGKVFYALNDVVVHRAFLDGCESQVIDLTAKIDGTVVDKFICDGLIVSTPTGSTAYSLSCGGGILTPDINGFSLTAICAHSLHNRPIVFSDKSVVKIEQNGSDCGCMLICDGKTVLNLKNSDEVTVEKAEIEAEFLKREDKSFYSKLLLKLKKWSGG